MTEQKPKTKADLKREIKELKAQLAHTYHFAEVGIKKSWWVHRECGHY